MSYNRNLVYRVLQDHRDEIDQLKNDIKMIEEKLVINKLPQSAPKDIRNKLTDDFLKLMAWLNKEDKDNE